MIKIVARNLVKVDKKDICFKLLENLVKETRELESGCVSYEIFEDIENPLFLTFFEVWKDQESFDMHLKQKHFKEIYPDVEQCFEGQSQVNFYRTLI